MKIHIVHPNLNTIPQISRLRQEVDLIKRLAEFENIYHSTIKNQEIIKRYYRGNGPIVLIYNDDVYSFDFFVPKAIVKGFWGFAKYLQEEGLILT